MPFLYRIVLWVEMRDYSASDGQQVAKTAILGGSKLRGCRLRRVAAHPSITRCRDLPARTFSAARSATFVAVQPSSATSNGPREQWTDPMRHDLHLRLAHGRHSNTAALGGVRDVGLTNHLSLKRRHKAPHRIVLPPSSVRFSCSAGYGGVDWGGPESCSERSTQ